MDIRNPTTGGGGGSGTVTSVALTVPGVIFTSPVSGSPVTTAGTLALALKTQTANTCFAGPTSGGAATPTFRALVTADLPAGTGTITSIAPADATLTFTPNPIVATGTIGINLSNANIWLAQQTDQGATTTAPGWYAQITGDTFARMRIGANALDIGSLAFGSGAVARDTNIQRDGVATFRFGLADGAAPIGQTFNVQNVLTGTANIAGANFTINGSIGTGTGAGGNIIFQCAPAGTTGSTPNALAAQLTIAPNLTTNVGSFSSGNVVVTANTVPTNGMYLSAANTLNLATNGSNRFTMTSSSITIIPDLIASNASSFRLMQVAATATVPTVIPNRASSTTGFGAQASGNISAIVASAEVERWTASGVANLTVFTVATLPAAPVKGTRTYVTDATAPVFAATLTGGGAVYTPVYFDNAAWRAG